MVLKHRHQQSIAANGYASVLILWLPKYWQALAWEVTAAFPLFRKILYETLQVRTPIITSAPFFLSAAPLCLASDLVLENGEIDIQSPITIGSEAHFECTGDGTLQGPTTRVCEAAGWSGMNPTCSEYTMGK